MHLLGSRPGAPAVESSENWRKVTSFKALSDTALSKESADGSLMQEECNRRKRAAIDIKKVFRNDECLRDASLNGTADGRLMQEGKSCGRECKNSLPDRRAFVGRFPFLC